LDLVAKAVCHGPQNLDRLLRDLGADSVAGESCDLKKHVQAKCANDDFIGELLLLASTGM
jgi:hypothetical protein